MIRIDREYNEKSEKIELSLPVDIEDENLGVEISPRDSFQNSSESHAT